PLSVSVYWPEHIRADCQRGSALAASSVTAAIVVAVQVQQGLRVVPDLACQLLPSWWVLILQFIEHRDEWSNPLITPWLPEILPNELSAVDCVNSPASNVTGRLQDKLERGILRRLAFDAQLSEHLPEHLLPAVIVCWSHGGKFEHGWELDPLDQ